MIGQLVLIVAGAALLAIAFALLVRRDRGRVTDFYQLYPGVVVDVRCPVGEAWWLGARVVLSLQQPPRNIAIIKNIT